MKYASFILNLLALTLTSNSCIAMHNNYRLERAMDGQNIQLMREAISHGANPNFTISDQTLLEIEAKEFSKNKDIFGRNITQATRERKAWNIKALISVGASPLLMKKSIAHYLLKQKTGLAILKDLEEKTLLNGNEIIQRHPRQKKHILKTLLQNGLAWHDDKTFCQALEYLLKHGVNPRETIIDGTKMPAALDYWRQNNIAKQTEVSVIEVLFCAQKYHREGIFSSLYNFAASGWNYNQSFPRLDDIRKNKQFNDIFVVTQ